ncbi:MAG: hypothetical protein SXQ77_10375, partial [Halobacteria archaeon]|nr:hypothetical protein [Halobacteria archaeon]
MTIQNDGTQPPFYKTAKATVQPDGTWTASGYDLTTPEGINAGDKFTITNSLTDAKGSGNVVASTGGT